MARIPACRRCREQDLHLSATLAAENIYIQIRPNASYFCLKPVWESVPTTWEAVGGLLRKGLPSGELMSSYQRLALRNRGLGGDPERTLGF